MKTSLRLNRFLAAAGVASRRRCDDLIRQGRVSVNGIRVTELGTRIDPRDIYGKAYAGPYPFEAEESDYAYKRFRIRAKIEEGKGELRLGYLLRSRSNSEEWVDQGRVRLNTHGNLGRAPQFQAIYVVHLGAKK